MTARATVTGEQAVVLETLAAHRAHLRRLLDGVTEDEARRRTTVSELTLGGILKHVIEVEDGWAEFVRTGHVRGAENWHLFTPEAIAAGTLPVRDEFHLRDDDTVAGLLRRRDEVAAATEELVATSDLDTTWRLPEAPWDPGERWWSARRTWAHVAGEFAQHNGHADIVREALEAQRAAG